MPIDIDPKTGAPVIVSQTNDSTPATSNPSSDFAVQDIPPSMPSTTEADNTTTDNKVSTDTNEHKEEVLASEAKKESTEVVTPEKKERIQEAKLRAIDRVLRTQGMDNQQADKAMVEIRRILL